VLIIPSALPLTVPLSVKLGIAFGLGGRTISRGGIRMLLLLVFISCAISFAMMAWVMPVANEAFRQDIFDALGNKGV
jgi:hypothetical protein